MADTIRETIIKDFVTQAATLTVANGYNYDFGANVIRGRTAIDPDECPALVILPFPEASSLSYGAHVNVMPIRIEGLVDFGTDNPSEVSEKILGDLVKCFASRSWSRSPDYADSITYTEGGTNSYPEAGESIVGAHVVMAVKYQTDIGDPYNQ